MRLDTLHAACDLVLHSEKREITVLLTGGEPLLAFPLVQEAVTYLRQRCPRGKRLRLALTTNGTLLTPRVVAFLSAHDVKVQLSFDGTPEAQALRGPSTFRILDRRLRQIRRSDGYLYRRRLSIHFTVLPATVRYLADSVDYFLRMGIREIAIGPSMTDDSGWTVDRAPELERQFARISQASRDHLGRTGEVPVRLLRRSAEDARPTRGGKRRGGSNRSAAMCGLDRGEILSVEPSGHAVPCLMFASMNAPRADSPLAGRLADLDLGDVRDPGFAARLSRMPETVQGCRIFTGREAKHASDRRCLDCPQLGACVVCPAAIVYQKGNRDPDRIPDFYCAFNRIALESRSRFPARPSFREALQAMENVATGSPSPTRETRRSRRPRASRRSPTRPR